MATTSPEVLLTDVVLRDGLQDEPVLVPVPDRLAVAEALTAAGLRSMEVASVVNPARVPQMAGAEEMIAGLPSDGPVRHRVLALNARGVHRAIAAGARDITVVASAGRGHSRANAGRDTGEALAGIADAVARATADHPEVVFTGGVSTAFVCPFDGEVPTAQLAYVVGEFTAMGVEGVGLADTLGTATPAHVMRSLNAVRDTFPDTEFGLHLHNAHGQALRTVDAALDAGVTRFDSAAGGYGGCPFAPGAHGNLATEELVTHLHARGVRTGIDEAALAEAIALVRACLDRAEPLAA
ncbi:hydroxymethylglutaryl-CoA lyase [Streptomyces sp. BH105]|uniref:hydroxymethylglutaryl-CoA lyase n=1 Tax=Streptomyces sp. BH105 TaxID=3410408 RepID=UPI003CFB4335